MPSGYALQEIAPDGNCLFSAIHEGCRRQKISTPWGNAYKLRELAMNNLTIATDSTLRTSIRHHLADQPGYKQRFPSYMSDRQVLETYQKEMKKPKRPNSVASHQWGGDLELDAIAKTHNITIKLYHPLPLTNQRLTSQWTTYPSSTNPGRGTVHLLFHGRAQHYDLLLPLETTKGIATARNRTQVKRNPRRNPPLGHMCITTPNDEEERKRQKPPGHTCITNDEEEKRKTKSTECRKTQQGKGYRDSNMSGIITRSSQRKKQ